MGKVQIEINNRRYAIGCDTGQEEHVARLARHFDTHVRQLAASVGDIGDQRLFLMGALLVADELHDARTRMDRAEAELARLRDARASEPTPAALKAAEEAEVAVAGMLDAAAERLDSLARRIEQA